jgi:hypothetical protein
MAAYVDHLNDWGWRYGRSCHLIADTLAELHAMAERIGMRRAWFQDKPHCRHYDLTAKRRALAIAAGAIPCSRVEFVNHMRRIREGSE